MKTKMIIIRILLFAISVYLVSCMPNESVFVRSFVTEYYNPTELILEQHRGNIYIRFEKVDLIGKYSSEGVEKSKYDRICEKHNDMSYNREIILNGAMGGIPPHIHIYGDWVTIEIVSDADWDDGHLAGSLLNSITMFYSYSPKKYIDSGYKEIYDWTNNNSSSSLYPGKHPGVTADKSPYHPVAKLVSDLTSQDMILLGDGAREFTYATLKFTHFPTANKGHNITVTLTTDEGETFSATINMVFE